MPFDQSDKNISLLGRELAEYFGSLLIFKIEKEVGAVKKCRSLFRSGGVALCFCDRRLSRRFNYEMTIA